jgi:RNA polymerase sigma factor (sigma-70 family)
MHLTLADAAVTGRWPAPCVAIIARMDGAQASSDEELMQAFAGGDAGAFETLYDRHALAVWRFVLRSVQDRAVTDDLVQDVWFSLVRQAPQYEPRARFRTWLFTLAHHRMVDHWRTHKQHASLDAESDEGAALAGTLLADSAYGPVRQVESREQADALLTALAGLPPVQREAFLLQAEGGMSVAEIADATGVSAETAKSRLRYARARLRHTLEAYA